MTRLEFTFGSSLADTPLAHTGSLRILHAAENRSIILNRQANEARHPVWVLVDGEPCFLIWWCLLACNTRFKLNGANRISIYTLAPHTDPEHRFAPTSTSSCCCCQPKRIQLIDIRSWPYRATQNTEWPIMSAMFWWWVRWWWWWWWWWNWPTRSVNSGPLVVHCKLASAFTRADKYLVCVCRRAFVDCTHNTRTQPTHRPLYFHRMLHPKRTFK